MTRTWLIGFALAALVLPVACWKKDSAFVQTQRIEQRSNTDIAPGVRMWLGDIKTTQVEIVISANGKEIARTNAAVKGDVLAFAANGSHWEVEVLRLESHLTHEDYAHVSVRKK